MNFSMNTLWFEITVITSIFSFGQIFFGHFEAYTPQWKRVLKIVMFVALACTISATFGRIWFFALLGVLLSAVMLIHAWWLPKNGINGLTAEPKEKYYALRGWQLKE
jgi:VanZ family protein